MDNFVRKTRANSHAQNPKPKSEKRIERFMKMLDLKNIIDPDFDDPENEIHWMKRSIGEAKWLSA